MSRAVLAAVAQQTIRSVHQRMKTDPSIMESICKTRPIQEEDLSQELEEIPSLVKPVEIWQADTFEAAAAVLSPTTRVCVLNMASDRRAGGGWLNGASAQEEALCRRSTLAFTLDPFGMRASGVPASAAIDVHYPLRPYEAVYSPDVLVFRAPDFSPLALSFKVDIVSMAAQRNPSVRNGNYVDDRIMRRKIDMLLRVPHACGFEGTLILGAFGCGAFHNPPDRVAFFFKEAIDKYGGYYERIIFAIYDPGRTTGNYEAFSDVFTL